MLVLVNKYIKNKIDRQQHKTTSNFVFANSLIAKFIRYDASSIASLFANALDWIRCYFYSNIYGSILLTSCARIEAKHKG